jgi:tRNA(Ile)-lysidine synthase
VARLLGEVRRCVAAVDGPLVLAVSGGCDSMALMYAMHRVAPGRVSAVATFDHGTGAAARRAVRLVRREGTRLGFRVLAGGGRSAGRSEAEWREARWRFLRRVADAEAARIVTAHTRDDHVETVLMRVLRGSGARGLAGLHAESAVVRPFLSVDRGTIRAFVDGERVPFVEDPTNDSRFYLRNRVRLDLLPALRAVRPNFDRELLELSRRAAAVREALDGEASRMSEVTEWGGVAVAGAALAGYSRESLAAVWPALAARAGLVLDRRGTERLVAFTVEGRVGGRVQVSGGWELHRGHERFELRTTEPRIDGERALEGEGAVALGGWRFRAAPARAGDPWTASLPAGVRYVVRSWRAGDRMVAAGSTQARRVKRFLSDARISGPRRSRWPVVVGNGVVVWIPGVRRSEAATARPGRSEVSFECELDDSG